VSWLQPKSGPQRGGTVVTAFGLKLDPRTAPMCRFGSQVVAASFNSTVEGVVCSAPPLFLNGSVNFDVSVNGGADWTQSRAKNSFYYFR
jgi:hypothetical protein